MRSGPAMKGLSLKTDGLGRFINILLSLADLGLL